jgi:two-component system cell cycle response regulator
MKILIADDDSVSRRMLEKMLEQAGYDVVAVENGRKAEEILSSPDGPRLALIDWVMPELDGEGLCRAMRSRTSQPYIYIILLTSKQSKADIILGLEAGADDYLIKPCDLDELKARLRTGQRILQLEDNLVEAREAMRFKATHDPLTSLWNHGAIFSILEKELLRAQHTESGDEERNVSVLLCDLDHFKQINDTYGHLIGDQVLQEVAQRLESAVRPCDAVGRYGGEEFLIVLKDCNELYARERAEEVRKAVFARPFIAGPGEIPLSISIGALAWYSSPDGTPAQLLHQVDSALYLAKSAGRNRVSFVSLGNAQLASAK